MARDEAGARGGFRCGLAIVVCSQGTLSHEERNPGARVRKSGYIAGPQCRAYRGGGFRLRTLDASQRVVRKSRGPGGGKLALGISMSLIATMAVTVGVAISPQLLGQWFTLFEEPDGSYKVEARVIGVLVTGVKSADLTIEIRVTNFRSFGVHLLTAYFTITDLQDRRTALIYSLTGDHVFPAAPSPGSGSVTVLSDHAFLVKPLGVGNRYKVVGTVTWQEVYGTVEVPADPGFFSASVST